MSDKYTDYSFRAVSSRPPIDSRAPAEEKSDKGARLSFAEHVGKLPEHEQRAIRGYLPDKIEGLSASKQRKILSEAIRRNDHEAVAILADCGVDLDRPHSTTDYPPLIESCEFGHGETVEVLLKKGANPNILSKTGNVWSALHLCVRLDERFKGKNKGYQWCAGLLLSHGADANLKLPLTGSTALHFVDPAKQPRFVDMLLTNGADPLARDAEGRRPKLRVEHFQSLTACITPALENGKVKLVAGWIGAVKRFLPDANAAKLLVRWAEFCNVDRKLSKQLHLAIKSYLATPDLDPAPEVVKYAKNYNELYDLDAILEKFAADELRPAGWEQGFHVEGPNYSVEKHHGLLMELAGYWADRDENHMDHVVGILRFAKASAIKQMAPQETRDALYRDVKKLRNRLMKNPDQMMKNRAKAIDKFLNPFNDPQ